MPDSGDVPGPRPSHEGQTSITSESPTAAVLKIQMRGVYKAFDATTVLDGINLYVATGNVIALIGASGSGKSTLLRCVNLLEPVDDGEIFFDGVDIAEPGLDPHRPLSFVCKFEDQPTCLGKI